MVESPGFRYDDRGRPLGLAWPERPEYIPAPVPKKKYKKPYKKRNVEPTVNSRIQNPNGLGCLKQEYCGRGLHLMSENAVTGKNGKRKCRPCINEYNKQWRLKKKLEAGNE